MSSENDFSKVTGPIGPEEEIVNGPEHAALIARLHAEECHPDYRYKSISVAVGSDDHKFFNVTPVLSAEESWEFNPEIEAKTIGTALREYSWARNNTFYLRCKK